MQTNDIKAIALQPVTAIEVSQTIPANDSKDDLSPSTNHESFIAEGTQEEWEALSDDEKSTEWETFHELNACGTADEMYFYRILMDMFLVGYVGH